LSGVLRDILQGKFVVLDGPDGCGKTTQLGRLADALTEAGGRVVRTRDPGGTDIGERIREVLLGSSLDRMDVRCETMLFMASRAQLVSEVIAPALTAGSTVLCDRFISSTCAYQGAAGHDVEEVIRLGQAAVGEVWPDVTCVLDLPAETGLHRARGRSSAGGVVRSGCASGEVEACDAMEARPLEFHRRVRELFRRLPELYPKPVVVVDAGGSADEVFQRIVEALARVHL
jgi:dTMP kinase